MKKIIFVFCFLMLVGCQTEYYYTTRTEVPEESKEAYANFVKETTRAATEMLSTSDYEDVDDTIDAAQRAGERIYGKTIDGLWKVSDSDSGLFIPYYKFTEKEKAIFIKVRDQ